ncbi:hypothetical protein [Microseira sp. BLCC-F43]|jgi:hypothetical protein|uniref:hypothetical protein n=1 Tax=Microseira sp. BLCC-F43 TaxID=3153602 RepID=UPI0035B912D1
MPIISFGLTHQPPAIGAFEIQSKSYSYNSNFGYDAKRDPIEFPLLAAIFRISSNVPVRIRLYQSLSVQQVDLTRPPNIAPIRGVEFDGILGGQTNSKQLELSPLCLIKGLLVPITIEKLLPTAGIINLSFELVG